MVVIVFGLPGSGKSYFAERLAKMIKAVYINSDIVRREVIDERSYNEEEKLLVYNEMLERMRSANMQNKNVILDGTFYNADIRKRFAEDLPAKSGLFFIEVKADEQIIFERLKKPRAYSDADFEVYKKIKQQWEPLNKQHLIVESVDNNIQQMLDEAKDYLNRKNDQGTN